MKRHLVLFAGVVSFCVFARASRADGAWPVFESGTAQNSLLELYTSEGCSSCPPAEAWLARLRSNPDLWKHVVPVAFHVTYWDNLGWPDRFAQSDFTQRQRSYAAAWSSDSVYTPEFVANGREWHPGNPISASPDAGVLRVRFSDATHVVVSFKPTQSSATGFTASVAPLAGGIVNDVRGGENSGRKLPHEFVALGLINTPMKWSDGEWTAQLTLPTNAVAPIESLAAWVTADGDSAPVQAVGGWLEKS
ncbi:MAG TPA: DUF1223 domain-containing protein [Chthoniobacterales bacterium]|nr:DUF1223 domain-containing protein [Chthoniobacterales bacterium]